jgi:hypothetical protein
LAHTYTNPATGDGGARQKLQSGRIGSATHSQTVASAQVVKAELIGSNTCSAKGITATGQTPVLALCQQLLAAGLDPDAAMSVYRQGVEALRIKSIGAGAKLTITDDRFGRPQLSPLEGLRRAPANQRKKMP